MGVNRTIADTYIFRAVISEKGETDSEPGICECLPYFSTSDTASATTDSSGQCSFTSSPANNANSMTLSITGVTHTKLTYYASANHDPDGDPDGTNVTVTKP